MKKNFSRKKISIFTKIFISLIFPSQFCLAQISSISSLVKEAQEKSPEVSALHYQVRSMEAKAALAVAPTEPNFSVTYNDMDYFADLHFSGSTVLQVTQPLGFPGKAWVARSALSRAASALEAQMHAAELQVSTNVKSSVYSLAQAQENLRLNRDLTAAYERILAVAKRRYESGAITQVDLINSQVALYSAQNDFVDLKAAERAAATQINVFLKRPIGTPIEVASISTIHIPTFNEQDIVEKMVQGRNEIRSARFQMEAADASYTLAKMAALPDFVLTGGTTFYNYGPASPTIAYNGSTQTYLIGLQLTIPLWFAFSEREAIRSASQDKAAADATLQSVLNQSRIALDSTLNNLRATKVKIENFEKHLLPLADQSLKLALVNYSSGKLEYQALSDTAAARRTVRQNYTAAVVSYLIGYANLGQLIGEDLSHESN